VVSSQVSDPSVAVIVVTFNGAPWIDQCLASLAGQSRLHSVIVVDNASTDDTLGIIHRRFPQVRTVAQTINLGFGAGNNIGIRAAQVSGARHLYLLNQDAWAPAGSVAALADFLDAHAEYGVASPLHCSPDESAVDRKTLANYLSLHARPYLADALVGEVRSHYRIRGVNAAAWMVRSETFDRVGGFDPLFFMYGEDDDWLDRLAHHSIGFALVPAIRVVHLRQSPAPPLPPDARAQREHAVRWAYSRLLLQTKRPGHTRARVLMTLCLLGLLDPLVDFAFDRDRRELAHRWRACARLLRQHGKVARHARTTAQTGRHFLT